jgi:hypothetical protein
MDMSLFLTFLQTIVCSQIIGDWDSASLGDCQAKSDQLSQLRQSIVARLDQSEAYKHLISDVFAVADSLVHVLSCFQKCWNAEDWLAIRSMLEALLQVRPSIPAITCVFCYFREIYSRLRSNT